jgi:hypothetical protein
MCPVPDARWQSLQWHCAMRIGFALTVKFTAPHRQCPVTNGSLILILLFADAQPNRKP